MNRILAFSDRNRKELLRDPLSYIFCLAFPLVMLVVMTLVDNSIPRESGMSVFHIQNLCAGIAVFGQLFIMLFTTLTVSKDRAGSFLVRLYATPMKSVDFIIGYMLPMLVICMVQNILIYAVSFVISLFTPDSLNPLGLLVSIPMLIPSAVMFIGFGMLFGSLFNDKAAPGVSSIIISLGSFLGSVWFDADATGGVMLDICKMLPFYYCTKSARSAVRLDFSASALWIPLLIVTGCAILLIVLSSLAFRSRMKADLA